MPPSDPALARARGLVAQIVPEDVADAGPEEDLRDYGLDSVRVMDLIARVAEQGGQIGYADLVGGPTLALIASALDGAAPTPQMEGHR
ncbi:phosphopantetheine-binding protein [Cellulomonas cellasea]|uniref:phosphopantetheine-binding protein n=1 Tax=Cellulomonas cellasea TaxID=43670 RepID=UPI0025A34423|nr:phosphopantetheine-binding protein [Cellulomonas cellasea]MDM8083679.1 phosphopantetheine-binding protein [Cellulomonas cellasea]